MKNVLRIVVIYIFYFTSSGCYSCGSSTVIDDKRTYEEPWREPNTQELGSIGRLIIESNISGCGEYYIKEVESGEYITACSPDGKNWTYYVAYPNTDKIYLASQDMESKLKAPY